MTTNRKALLILILLAVTASADISKISPDLQPLLNDRTRTVDVIVQYNSPPQTCSAGFLGALVCTVVNVAGGLVKTVFSLLNAVTATLTIGDVITTSNQSNVSYISLDRTVTGALDYSSGAVGAASAAAQYGLDGSGIGIAIIDSGIYPHPDLAAASGIGSRIVYRQNFAGGLLPDDFGHGTHVAGIAAGNGRMSIAPGSPHVLRGIAPNAKLLDLRVLDANGASRDSAVIAAIQQAVKLKDKYNVRVINLSLGRPIYEGCSRDPLCQAVEAAWKNGIVVVVAAGNLGRNGYASVLSPGNSPRAITVGAMKTLSTVSPTDDLVASYSSKGPSYLDLTVKPDLVAPGNQVVSLLAPGSTLARTFPANIETPSYFNGLLSTFGQYIQLSGTSMATPVVTGTVALMLQHDPSLSPDTVKARLMKTASKNFPAFSTATDPATGQAYVSAYDIFTIGAGYLNVPAALANTDVAQKSAASPVAQYSSQTMTGTLQFSSSQLWNSSPAWPASIVWSGSALIGGSTVWNAVSAWSANASWGTNIIWSDSGPNGVNIIWSDTGVGEK